MMHDLMRGGVVRGRKGEDKGTDVSFQFTLERPLRLIDKRNTLWQRVECQKETIRKPKGVWSSLFSKEKKKVEQEKRKVIQVSG